MKLIQKTKFKREQRKKRVRAKIFGTGARPRLSVFRSNSHVYAQLIDDTKNATLAASTDLGLKEALKKSLMEKARLVGIDLAAKAKTKNIQKVVFDRGRFTYKGAVAALAQKVREEGIKF